MKATSRNEQETILNYDALLDEWWYYSDTPKHNRKWNELMEPERKEVDSYGQIVLLEGKVTGSVNINKPRKMTTEQKEQYSKRMREIRDAKNNSLVSE
jgi:hypothetical protein